MEEKALMMLLKAFKEEKWANEFLDGCLYCNTLSFHRKKDKHEGTVVILGSNIHEFKINNVEFKTVGSIKSRPDKADDIHVFCMYCWAPPFVDSSKKQVILNKKAQLGSLRTLEDEYGPHAVMIRDLPEFFRRITAAIKPPESPVYHAVGTVVKYQLMDRFVKNENDMTELAFSKDPKYKDENEYRLVFFSDRAESGPLRVHIGSIHDIAGLTRTRDIYDSIMINGSTDF